MDISERGLEVIKRWEGFRAKAYRCPAGVWTIGYGTTHGVRPGQTITIEHATELLKRDCAKREDYIESVVKRPMTQGQFDAFVSFAYNVGLGAFGKSTLLRKFNAGDIEGAAQQFRRWNKASGRVLQGLVNRRRDEEALFRS